MIPESTKGYGKLKGPVARTKLIIVEYPVIHEIGLSLFADSFNQFYS